MSNATTDPYNEQLNRRYAYDLTERVLWTFVQAFLAFWTGAALLNGPGEGVWSGVVDTSILEKAALAGFAAVISLVKGLVAKRIGASSTAATLPSYDDTPHA